MPFRKLLQGLNRYLSFCCRSPGFAWRAYGMGAGWTEHVEDALDEQGFAT